MHFLSDTEISTLINEPKTVSPDIFDFSLLKDEKKNKLRDIDALGKTGSNFKILLRQSSLDVFNFSAILCFIPQNTNEYFKLLRFNGKHEHTNNIEDEKFFNFHIHRATERYQKQGSKEEKYAEQTADYSTLQDALKCLVKHANISLIDKQGQPHLF